MDELIYKMWFQVCWQHKSKQKDNTKYKIILSMGAKRAFNENRDQLNLFIF